MTVLKVDGMKCGHCAGKVTASVLTVSGVKSAHVALDRHEVHYTGEADRDAIVASIIAAGYRVLAADT